MPQEKIDSNVVGLHIAEEASLGVLPGSNQEEGVWYPMEPNEFDDFGGELSTVVRDPLSESRQNQKGVISDLEASGGFGQDFTFTTMRRLLQGFMFADARERVSTAPVSGDVAKTITLESVTAAGSIINVGAGNGSNFQVGHILKLAGSGVVANNLNDLVISSIATDALTVATAGTLEDEGSPPATAKLEITGFQFGDSVAGIDFTGGTLKLTRSSGDFTADGLNVGEWIFIGGDAAATQFSNNGPGYARIIAISATELTLREPTWTPQTEAGAPGKTIQIYYGTFIRNEKDAALIKRRTYQLERTLGSDDDGVQSEYLTGATPNEFTVNLTSADKITVDMSFVATDNVQRTGDTGLKPGTRVPLTVETAFNTSSDVYQLRLFVDDGSASPISLYSRVMEASLAINNGAQGLKAIGTLGSFDVNVGDFDVSGELEVYFSTIGAVQAVRQNSDVGFNMIASKLNQGFVFDIPLLSLSGAVAQVEADEPIKLPVDKQGAENDMGYTLGVTFFSYLPDIAMADQT